MPFFKVPDLVSETILVKFEIDTLAIPLARSISVFDNRVQPGKIIAVDQVKKLMYIPVDRFFELEEPLADVVQKSYGANPQNPDYMLSIENITIWYDTNIRFQKVMVLNGYTRLLNEANETVKEWQWEFQSSRIKKKNREKWVGDLAGRWIKAQHNSLEADIPAISITPHKYRRKLNLWSDYVYLKDGYILDVRMSLDFPTDQLKSYLRKNPGIYFRKSTEHESIAMSGTNLTWFYRLNSMFQSRIDGTIRIGFNNFERSKFDHVDWHNIFLVNIGTTASIEYQPPFYKGIYGGLGVHYSHNLLPDIIEKSAFGVLLTVGVTLP